MSHFPFYLYRGYCGSHSILHKSIGLINSANAYYKQHGNSTILPWFENRFINHHISNDDTQCQPHPLGFVRDRVQEGEDATQGMFSPTDIASP